MVELLERIFFFILVSLTVYPLQIKDAGFREFLYFIALFITIFCFSPIVLVYANSVISVAKINEVTSKNQFLINQIENQQEIIEATRKNRHDLRHHNIILLQMAQGNNTDGIISYLKKYMKSVDDVQERIYCKNDTTNLILSYYENQCKENGIEYQTKISLDGNLSISDSEYTAIVSNILENAVKGAIESENDKKIVKIVIVQQDTKLIISCHNSCIESLNFEDNVPKELIGTGISSIISSVKKLSGMYSFSANEGVFKCNIVFSSL